MPTEQAAAPKLKTNLDTGLLKLIAILSMAVDHVGSVFFPKYPVFRWIGRLTFPIFAYCLTVGLLYTHDIKKHLVRLLAMRGLHTKKWWLFIAMFVLASLVNFDDSAGGIILMLIFYLCRSRALRSVLAARPVDRLPGGP